MNALVSWGVLSVMLVLPTQPVKAQVPNYFLTQEDSIKDSSRSQPPDPSRILPITDPVDLSALIPSTPGIPPGKCPAPAAVVTSRTACQIQPTIPSLWWAKEQFGGRLLSDWLAYSGAGKSVRRVDLIVNEQVWSLLDYLERYGFINQFGKAAQLDRYDTRVFNRQGLLLAAYTCRSVAQQAQLEIPLNQPAPDLGSNICQITLDSSGQNSFRGR